MAERLRKALVRHDRDVRPMPGIGREDKMDVLIRQLIDSERRVGFVRVIGDRDISDDRANPNSRLFDPIRAAILHLRAGRRDEAFWNVFLFVHFGQHRRGGYRYARDVYSRLGDPAKSWNWSTVSRDPQEFRKWLERNQDRIRRSNEPGGFGNHRKYESLSGTSPNGTGAAVSSYVNWIGSSRSHDDRFTPLIEGRSPSKAFEALYSSMSCVVRFGRTARFDYLAMVGKTRLLDIAPGRAYLKGSTGPLRGARKLFGAPEAPPDTLDEWVQELGQSLDLGMQALEDALCNWQKSPRSYRRFGG